MKMNKSGIWRVIESVTAILILAGAILLLINKQEIIEKNDIREKLLPILQEIAKNETIREKILSDDSANREAEDLIIAVLKEKLPNANLNHNTTICDMNDKICNDIRGYPSDLTASVYSAERVVSASLTVFNPKTVRIYIWEK